MKLLRQADIIESARQGGIWDTLSSHLDTCSSLVGSEDASHAYYDNITECEKAIAAVTRLKDAVSEEGVLTCLDNLEVKFVQTPEISLGHIEEPTGWWLVKKIALPKDKYDKMNECIALSGRRVAVGYYNGGVDIVSLDNEERMRILDGIPILGFSEIDNDVLAVCTTKTKLSTYNISSTSDKTSSFLTKLVTTSEYHGLCTDTYHNIYLGYREFKTIEVFDQSGGSPIRTIKTELEPWFISVIKSDHIAVTQNTWGVKDAVHVIKQDGTVVCRIPGSDGHAPYSTCDQLGNIYIALKQRESDQVNIKKFSAEGIFLELVVSNLQVNNFTGRSWIHISCVSPTELILCDNGHVYVFQRRPTLTELMNLITWGTCKTHTHTHTHTHFFFPVIFLIQFHWSETSLIQYINSNTKRPSLWNVHY